MYQKQLTIPTVDYIYGLGGRMITPEEIHYLYDELAKVRFDGRPADTTRWLGVRE